MTTRQFVILMVICTILCWSGCLLVLFFINPETIGTFGLVLFYLSLFFALTGTLAIFSYLFRFFLTRRYSPAEEITISFRQAMFWSIVMTTALLLQSQRLLSWLNALILVILTTALEYLIITRKKTQT